MFVINVKLFFDKYLIEFFNFGFDSNQSIIITNPILIFLVYIKFLQLLLWKKSLLDVVHRLSMKSSFIWENFVEIIFSIFNWILLYKLIAIVQSNDNKTIQFLFVFKAVIEEQCTF